jgi:hypothetical protein
MSLPLKGIEMGNAFVAFGHGYETGSRGRCEAFDGFDIIAAPLGEWSEADRESRVWRAAGATSGGVTYGSHAIKLATKAPAYDGDKPRGLYILGQHGGGREVLALDTGPDWKAVRDALLLLDERTLYAVLYSIWQTAASARTQAQSETQRKWSLAYVDGRIRKSRQGGQVRVYVESPLERDFRKGKVKLNAVAFNLSTKEMELA